MKKLIVAILATGLAFGTVAAKQKAAKTEPEGFQFTDVKVVKTTPVKDQHKSGTCWCYSTNTFFESEIYRKTGKEIHLSEGFVVHHCYYDKGLKYVRMDGQINFAEGGAAADIPYVWANYGMMPNEAYTGMTNGDKKFNTSELSDALKGYLSVINKRQLNKLTPSWKKGFAGILDAYMGEIPETFEYEGKQYTPKSFAESLPIDLNDYVSISSYTHHPFYKPFTLEVADNWLWFQYQNVPIDELIAIVYNAIDKGYALAWGADVSERGFKWSEGYAVYPVEKDMTDLKGSDMARWAKLSDSEREKEKWEIKGPGKEKFVTQEERQEMFDNKETTDDHGMVIVGTAVDQKGNKYFKVQNSWDTNQKYDGFFYVSEAFFRAKTMNITVNKEAVPADIAKKMGF